MICSNLAKSLYFLGPEIFDGGLVAHNLIIGQHSYNVINRYLEKEDIAFSLLVII